MFIATTKYQDDVFGVQDMLRESREAATGKARLDAYISCWGAYIPKIFAVAKTLMVMKETDEEAAAAWADRMGDVREGCEAAIDALERDGHLTTAMSSNEATEYLWTLLSISNWENLTQTCGWDQARYQDVMKSTARAMLSTG